MNQDLKKKIENALNSDFIGEVVFTKQEIDEMCEDCRKSYAAVIEHGSKNAKIYVEKEKIYGTFGELVVCFVNIIKNTMNNPNYEEKIFYDTIIQNIFKQPIQQSLFYDVFKEVFEKYGKALFKSNKNITRYRESLLAQALMPYSSIYNFIKLLYSWYSDNTILNFEYKNKKLLNQMCNFLHEEFSTDIDSEDKQIFGTTYNITASFKYMFLQDINTGRKLVDNILRNINKYCNECDLDEQNYINKIIKDVLENENIKEKKKNKYKDKIATDYSSINVEYRLSENNKLALFIPRIISSDKLKTNILYIVEEYGKELEVPKKVKGNNINSYIEEEIIELDKISKTCNKISFKIINKDTGNLIYDSKDLLYRKYILFNKNKKEISRSFYKPKDYYLYSNDVKSINVKKYDICENNIYYLSPENNEYIDVGSKIYFTEAPRINAILCGQMTFKDIIYRDIKNSKFIFNGTEYDIYDNVSSILFPDIETIDIKNTKIKIDGDIFDFSEKCYNICDEYRIYLNDYNTNGRHCISIYNDTERTDIYYYINKDFVVYKFNKFALSGKISYFDYDLYGEEFTEEILPSQESIQIEMDGGYVELSLGYFKWKLTTEEDWHYTSNPVLELFYNDDLLGNFYIDVKSNTVKYPRVLVNEVIAPIKNGYFDIKPLLEDLRKTNDIIVVRIEISSKFKPDIIKIYNKPHIKSFKLDLENQFYDIKKFAMLNKNDKLLINADKIMGGPLIISESGELSKQIVDGLYHNVKISTLDWLGQTKLIKEYDKLYLGNIKKTLFNNKNIEIKFNGRINGMKLHETYILYDIQYVFEKLEGDLILTTFSAKCDGEDLTFDIYIPKNAKYDCFINSPIIAYMQNVENVIDDGNGKIITAFYKSEKDKLDENSMYYYSIIKK